MSKDDEQVLQNHGFGKAAFGAVSFNHHRQNKDVLLDSMDYIPIWLRTFVADTLRYIEYERRALPVALVCNHFSQEADCHDHSIRQGTSSGGKKSEKSAGTKDPNPANSRYSGSATRQQIGRKLGSSQHHAKTEPNNSSKPAEQGQESNTSAGEGNKKKNIFAKESKTTEDSRPIPGSKPENQFLYFSRQVSLF